MDGWMDVVSFRFVGVKRMTMNEQSTFLGQGGGREETFRFSLLQITHHNCFSFHFSNKRPLVMINFITTKYANYVVLFLGDWILPTN